MVTSNVMDKQGFALPKCFHIGKATTYKNWKAGSPVTKQSYLYQNSAEGKSGTLNVLVKETMTDSFFKIHEKRTRLSATFP